MQNTHIDTTRIIWTRELVKRVLLRAFVSGSLQDLHKRLNPDVAVTLARELVQGNPSLLLQ